MSAWEFKSNAIIGAAFGRICGLAILWIVQQEMFPHPWAVVVAAIGSALTASLFVADVVSICYTKVVTVKEQATAQEDG